MNIHRDFPDYAFEAREDACRILDDHVEEIVEALVAWHKTDRSQSFDLNEVDGHSWVCEGHRYSGIVFDMWTGCAVLESIPADYHETDPTQWTEHRRLPGESRIQIGPPKGAIDLPETIGCIGQSTYEHYVGCCVGEMLETMAERTTEMKRLGRNGLGGVDSLSWGQTMAREAGEVFRAPGAYRLHENDPDATTPVAGHENITLSVAALIYDSLQQDALWDVDEIGYNFRHIVDVASAPAFPAAGALYRIEHVLTPTSGQIILVRFRLHAV